eukprot:m.91642 g.91642  ORF g.91642 m.91642 type:complete len:148 (-) comp20189_c0_seq1:252-695(-)
MAGYPYFAVVSREGKPIFEEWFDSRYAAEAIDQAEPKDDLRYFHQLLAHKSLDSLLDNTQEKASHMYLKVIDTFNEWAVSAYVTGGQTRLLLLHDRSISNNDGIKNFFQEVHETYVKAMLNPLYATGTKIESRDFKTKVRSFAVRYL